MSEFGRNEQLTGQRLADSLDQDSSPMASVPHQWIWLFIAALPIIAVAVLAVLL